MKWKAVEGIRLSLTFLFMVFPYSWRTGWRSWIPPFKNSHLIAALNDALLKCTNFHSRTITICQFPSNASIFGAVIRPPQIASEAATYMVANRTTHFTRKNTWGHIAYCTIYLSQWVVWGFQLDGSDLAVVVVSFLDSSDDQIGNTHYSTRQSDISFPSADSDFSTERRKYPLLLHSLLLSHKDLFTRRKFRISAPILICESADNEIQILDLKHEIPQICTECISKYWFRANRIASHSLRS